VGDTRNSYKILIGNPEGKRLFRRPRFRFEGNLKEGLCEAVRLVELTGTRSGDCSSCCVTKQRTQRKCYSAGDNLLSSLRLFKNVKTEMYTTIILLFAVCGCKYWSLA
jgi:hypothetical protein